jgi:hypothetical protein
LAVIFALMAFGHLVGLCWRLDCPAAECSFVGGHSPFAHGLHRQARFTRNDQFMMQQLVLDMGHGQAARRWQTSALAPICQHWQHLLLWLGKKEQAALRSPVPTYLWGDCSSGKTHLLRAVDAGLPLLATGWLAGSTPPASNRRI